MYDFNNFFIIIIINFYSIYLFIYSLAHTCEEFGTSKTEIKIKKIYIEIIRGKTAPSFILKSY